MKKGLWMSALSVCLFVSLFFATFSYAEPFRKSINNNVVRETYETMINLTKNDLETRRGAYGTAYSYDGYAFVHEDNDWINSKLNKNGTVESGAIYRKISYLLISYEIGFTKMTDLSEDLFGIKVADNSELEPYVNRMKQYFITEGQVLPAVMKEFRKLKTITGEYDFDNWRYNLTISDVRECAQELQISQKALGYLFGMLNEYAAEITFNEYQCTIRINWTR